MRERQVPGHDFSTKERLDFSSGYFNCIFYIGCNLSTGILRPYERLILERAETDGDVTPRPLIVIDCKK